MYKIIFLPDAEDSFKRLDKNIQKRITEKIDWLADNADKIIHHSLKYMPDDLKGKSGISFCKKKINQYVQNGFAPQNDS